MDEERLQVLQMVAAGTITPEQGEDLLAALAPTRERARSVHTGDPEGAQNWSGARTSGSTLTRLSEARMHGVTPEYIRALAELGYRNLSLEQYVELRVHGVSPDFIRDMRSAGYSDMSLRQLIDLRVSGINPDYVREMIALGFGDQPTAPAFEQELETTEEER